MLVKGGFASVHIHRFSLTGSVRWSQEFMRICVHEHMHPPSTHLLWTLVKSETADGARLSCLDVSVTTHAVDLQQRLALADYVLTRLGEGDGYVDQSEKRYLPLVGHYWKDFSNHTWTRLCTTPSVIFSSNGYRQTWDTDSLMLSEGADVPIFRCTQYTLVVLYPRTPGEGDGSSLWPSVLSFQGIHPRMCSHSHATCDHAQRQSLGWRTTSEATFTAAKPTASQLWGSQLACTRQMMWSLTERQNIA